MAITAPVELVLVRFPENNFRGEIVSELEKLVKNHIIKIIDILFVTKDKKGNVAVAEMTDLEDEDYQAITPIISDSAGILSEEDAQELTKDMKNNTSAGIMLFEDTWASELSQAVDRAGGEV